MKFNYVEHTLGKDNDEIAVVIVVVNVVVLVAVMHAVAVVVVVLVVSPYLIMVEGNEKNCKKQ